jgi:hypothetical protein
VGVGGEGREKQFTEAHRVAASVRGYAVLLSDGKGGCVRVCVWILVGWRWVIHGSSHTCSHTHFLQADIPRHSPRERICALEVAIRGPNCQSPAVNHSSIAIYGLRNVVDLVLRNWPLDFSGT